MHHVSDNYPGPCTTIIACAKRKGIAFTGREENNEDSGRGEKMNTEGKMMGGKGRFNAGDRKLKGGKGGEG